MSHHSSDKPMIEVPRGADMDPAALKKRRLKLDELNQKLGATGDHPAGRIVPHDEGGLVFGVTVFNGRVVFDFGKPIRSLAFTRDDALQLAELLKQRAEQCPPIIKAPPADGGLKE
jgi:hypothetical protein